VAEILVIDADELFAIAIQRTLEGHGHSVTIATDGRQGTAEFQSKRFDGVICDLLMPNQEAFEIIQRLRKSRPDLCIVAISGGVDTKGVPETIDLLGMARELGADVTFKKPVRFSALAAALETVIVNRKIISRA
jgi:two-component system OmpR family response regulator